MDPNRILGDEIRTVDLGQGGQSIVPLNHSRPDHDEKSDATMYKECRIVVKVVYEAYEAYALRV